MKILLIRHAESTANAAGILDTLVPGPPLTADGRRQAEELPARLAELSIGGLYASTMRRTSETALPLSNARQLPVTIVKGLHEIEAGQFEGAGDRASVDSYRAVIGHWAQGHFDRPIPGAHDGAHFLDRFDRAIETIVSADPRAEAVVVVTHSVAIRVWVASRAVNCSPAFTSTEPLDNAGVVELQVGDDQAVTLTRWQQRVMSSD